jgi:predicted TIM-barrel fold metal-dependent hydrolase
MTDHRFKKEISMPKHPIIDAHAHIGDILHLDGGNLIWKRGVKKRFIWDPISTWAAMGFRNFGLGNLHYRILLKQVIAAEQARNAAATLENLRRSMDRLGITHSVCMPIFPYVVFADLAQAAKKEPGVIPFTCVDVAAGKDFESQLVADKRAGAKGLKLHAIIQNVSLDDQRMHMAAQAAGKIGLPVLFHCGISHYYKKGERYRDTPQYGAVEDARNLVREHPDVAFVAGHAGMFEMEEVIAKLAPFENVCVDTSIQCAANIRRLLHTFGSDRVLFASDWPFGQASVSLACAKAACKGDQTLIRKVLYGNAARLYGIEKRT